LWLAFGHWPEADAVPLNILSLRKNVPLTSTFSFFMVSERSLAAVVGELPVQIFAYGDATAFLIREGE
jgi:hypothetical protein